MKTITIQKSKQQGKRYKITMDGFPDMKSHSHNFGSKFGITYIDNQRTDKEKQAWYARHRGDKNFNNMHSAIYMSKNILWGDSKNIITNLKKLGNDLEAKIVIKGKL
jgi:hypothetical protein